MQKEKIILYGAGRMAEMLFASEDWKKYYQIVSIADSDESKHGKCLEGIEIVLPCQALNGYMRNYKTACAQSVPRRITGPALGTGILLLCQALNGYMRNYK